MFIKDILIDFGLATIFAFATFMMLGEYRQLFMTDPKGALSVEALKRIIHSSGARGYFATFFITASVLCMLAGVMTLLVNVAPLMNMLE